MHEKHILCLKCGKRYPLGTQIFLCSECGSSLEVVFDYRKLKKEIMKKRLSKRPFNHLRYKELYPVKKPISVGEGGTPLLRSRNIETIYGLDFSLHFKCEYQNPTGSFKDRGSSVEVAKALEFGSARAVCASTGNMGASVSAYSSASGLKTSIFVPRDAVITKIQQILAYGSAVYRVQGDYTKAAGIAEKMSKNKGFYLLGDYLYRREGTKSVGFEIAEQTNPDYVVFPIGNGTLISSAWKAFREFKMLGIIKKLPKLAGMQASGCSPVTEAWKRESEISPVKGKTVAVAIECGNPIDGDRALSAIRESGGFAGTVTDKEILKARNILSRNEGIFAEPAGAVALAGILKYKDKIKQRSNVVCLVTGHGLKSPKTGVPGKLKEFTGLR